MNYTDSGKVGPIQEVGNTSYWLENRQTQPAGEKNKNLKKKQKKQVKTNSLEQLPNVTEHREATKSGQLFMKLIRDPKKGQERRRSWLQHQAFYQRWGGGNYSPKVELHPHKEGIVPGNEQRRHLSRLDSDFATAIWVPWS